MTLNIGENLKIYRSKKRVTQEQLAYEFGVSPQAVSRWETGATYPDITLLPVIAKYFNVTVDELLGVVNQCPDEEKKRYLNESLALRHDGKVAEALVLDRELLRKYPSDEDALSNLMYQLYSMRVNEHNGNYDGEIISTANRLINTSKNTDITSGAKQLLIYVYSRRGESEKAKEIAQTLDPIYCCRDVLYPEAFKGDEEIKLRQGNILVFADLLYNELLSLARCEKSSDNKAEIYTVSNKMITMLLGENPAFYNERITRNHCELAYLCAGNKDREKAMEHLRLALKYAEQFEFRPEKSRYTPCWLGFVRDKKSDSTKDSQDTLFDHILQRLENGVFDFMRDTADFKNYSNEIIRISDKLKRLK